MNRIHFLFTVVFIAFSYGHSNAANRKPNFLFIYTDDQRWDAMGVVQREQGAKARQFQLRKDQARAGFIEGKPGGGQLRLIEAQAHLGIGVI